MEKEQLIALVRKGQAGDTDATEKLLQYAHTSVSYQCRKMLKNAQDAEDMTQEVLVAIYTKLNMLQDPAAFQTWVNRITVSRCINALNRTHVEYQFAEDEDGHSVLDNLEELDEQVIPDKAIDNAETARMIEEIVDGLPDAQRIATLMFYYDELSVKEIASVMKVSENTVKSRLHYARKAIKEKVLDYEKQGIKLYGLSPLPFLLYFLRTAAHSSADKKAAGVMADKVMATTSVAATGAATVAGSTASTGLFASFSAKVAAGILAAVVTIGGTAAIVIPQIQEDPAESVGIRTDEVFTAPTWTEATDAAEPTETEPMETEPAETEPTETADDTDNEDSDVCSACGNGRIIAVNLTEDPCAIRLDIVFQCDHCGAIAGYSNPRGKGHTVGITEDGQYEICTVCGEILAPVGIGHGGVTDENYS